MHTNQRSELQMYIGKLVFNICNGIGFNSIFTPQKQLVIPVRWTFKCNQIEFSRHLQRV